VAHGRRKAYIFLIMEKARQEGAPLSTMTPDSMHTLPRAVMSYHEPHPRGGCQRVMDVGERSSGAGSLIRGGCGPRYGLQSPHIGKGERKKRVP
jgi:hypothetical protein